MESIRSGTGISTLNPWRPLILTYIIIIALAGTFHCGEGACPLEQIERNGYCYKLYNEKLPWQSAATECGHFGGFLTSIVSRQENAFLVESFRNRSSLAWIGMDSTGRWLDGSSSQMFYNNFRYETLSKFHCSVIDLAGFGRWNVSNCKNSELNFICKYEHDGYGSADGSGSSEDEDLFRKPNRPTTSRIIIYTLIGLFALVCCFCGCVCKGGGGSSGINFDFDF